MNDDAGRTDALLAARFHALVENMPCPFWAMDGEGRYTMQNRASREAFGEVIGRTVDALDAPVALRRRCKADFKRIMTGEVINEEYSFVRDGRRIVHSIVASPVWRHGRIDGLVGFSMDVTHQRETERALLKALDELEGEFRSSSSALADRDEDLRRALEDSRRAESSRLESESRLEAILSSIDDGAVLVYDRDGRIVSAWIGERFGAQCDLEAPDSRQATQVEDVFPLENAAARMRRIREVFASGLSQRWEHALGEGEKAVWCDSSFSPVHGASGAVAFVSEFLHEVSARRKVEDALRRSDERLRSLADALPAIIAVVEKNRVLYVNDSVRGILGYTPQEVLTTDPWGPVAEEDTQRLRPRLLEILDGEEESLEFEMRTRHRDGGERWLNVCARPFDWEDRRALLLASFDITDRRRAEEALRENEERFRALSETTNAALFIVQGEQMRIAYVNRGAEVLLGLRESDLLGRAWWELAHPETRDIDKSHLASQMRGEDAPGRYETRIVTHGGEERWVDISISHAPSEENPGLVLLLLDVTARKQAEEALRANDRLLQRVLNATRDGVTVLDRDFTILRTNRVVEERFSHAMPLVGAKCHMAYRRLNKPCPDCPTRAAIKKRKPQSAEIPMAAPDGSRTGWLELLAVPLQEGPDSEVVQVVEFARDITDRRQRQEAVEARLRLERSRARIGRLFSSAGEDPDFERMLALLAEALQVDGAAYYEALEEDGPRFGLRSSWTDEDGPFEQGWPGLHPGAAARILRQQASPSPIVVNNARTEPASSNVRSQPFLEGRPLQAILAITLCAQERVVGLLEVGLSHAPRAWTEDEQRLMRRCAEMLTHHLERRESARALQKRLGFEAGLAACSRALLVASPGAIDRALGELLRIAEACRAYIFHNHEAPGRGLCMSQIHETCMPGVEPQIDNPDLQDIPYADGFERWRRALANGQAIQGDVSSYPEKEREVLAQQGILSLLVLPVRCHGQWWGFIGFDDTHRSRSWSAEDRRLLRLGSELIALYIESNEPPSNAPSVEGAVRELALRALDGLADGQEEFSARRVRIARQLLHIARPNHRASASNEEDVLSLGDALKIVEEQLCETGAAPVRLKASGAAVESLELPRGAAVLLHVLALRLLLGLRDDDGAEIVCAVMRRGANGDDKPVRRIEVHGPAPRRRGDETPLPGGGPPTDAPEERLAQTLADRLARRLGLRLSVRRGEAGDFYRLDLPVKHGGS